MTDKHVEQLLSEAAAAAIARIRADRERVDGKLKPFLAYLEENLFKPRLTVERWKEALGIRDNSLMIALHSALGVSPRRYIEDRRMEVARDLLETSDLQIWKIAEALGFSSLGVFSKAFERHHGQRPSVYRKGLAAGARDLGTKLSRMIAGVVDAIWEAPDPDSRKGPQTEAGEPEKEAERVLERMLAEARRYCARRAAGSAPRLGGNQPTVAVQLPASEGD